MKKIMIILFLIPLLIASTTVNKNLKIEVITNGTNIIHEITHEKTNAYVYNDANTKTIQKINVLKSNGNVDTTVWSYVAEDGTLVNRNIIDIARNFEQKNPGYEVIAAVNGDYFTTNQTINANIVHGGYMINPYNNEKFLSIEMNPAGQLIQTHKRVTSGKLYAYFYDEKTNALYDVVELLPINSRAINEGQTSIYYNYNQIDEINHQFYTFDIDQKSILSSHTMFRLSNATLNNGTIPQTTNQVSMISKDENINKLLATGVRVKIQPILVNVGESHTMLGVDSMILDNRNVRAFTDIGGQGDSNNKSRHPRTAIGFDINNNPILLTVDGRQPGISQGVDLRELAHILKEHGAVYGFNIDGGGSTQAIIKQDDDFVMVNNPSDNPYRRVSNAVLFIKPIDKNKVNIIQDEHHITFKLPNFNYDVFLDGKTIEYRDLNIEITKNQYENQVLSIVNKDTNIAVMNTVIYKSKEKAPILPIFNVSYEVGTSKIELLISFEDPEMLIDRMYVINNQTLERKVALVQYKGLRIATFDSVPLNQSEYTIYYELKNGMKGDFIYTYIEKEEIEEKNNLYRVIASSVVIISVLSILIIKRKRK